MLCKWYNIWNSIQWYWNDPQNGLYINCDDPNCCVFISGPENHVYFGCAITDAWNKGWFMNPTWSDFFDLYPKRMSLENLFIYTGCHISHWKFVSGPTTNCPHKNRVGYRIMELWNKGGVPCDLSSGDWKTQGALKLWSG